MIGFDQRHKLLIPMSESVRAPLQLQSSSGECGFKKGGGLPQPTVGLVLPGLWANRGMTIIQFSVSSPMARHQKIRNANTTTVDRWLTPAPRRPAGQESSRTRLTRFRMLRRRRARCQWRRSHAAWRTTLIAVPGGANAAIVRATAYSVDEAMASWYRSRV